MEESQSGQSKPLEHGSEQQIHKLPLTQTIVEPSSTLMESLTIYRTTGQRWIEIIERCKTRHPNLLGISANVFLGVFLTSLGPAISEYLTQKNFSLTPWLGIATLSAVAAIICGAAFLQVGTYESGTLNSLLGELREHVKRFER
jgi:hypothetical protein